MAQRNDTLNWNAKEEKARYMSKEMADAMLDDLRSDIDFAVRQAKDGPYYPEKGITRESLLEYAELCRQQIRDAGGVA